METLNGGNDAYYLEKAIELSQKSVDEGSLPKIGNERNTRKIESMLAAPEIEQDALRVIREWERKRVN